MKHIKAFENFDEGFYKDVEQCVYTLIEEYGFSEREHALEFSYDSKTTVTSEMITEINRVARKIEAIGKVAYLTAHILNEDGSSKKSIVNHRDLLLDTTEYYLNKLMDEYSYVRIDIETDPFEHIK